MAKRRLKGQGKGRVQPDPIMDNPSTEYRRGRDNDMITRRTIGNGIHTESRSPMWVYGPRGGRSHSIDLRTPADSLPSEKRWPGYERNPDQAPVTPAKFRPGDSAD